MTVGHFKKAPNPHAASLEGQLTKILTEVSQIHHRGLVEPEIASQEQIHEPAI